MATYVNDLRLTELATGEGSGTWGTTTNTNLELIGEALGYGTQNCFASDADSTTTVADGATDPARSMYFKVTSSATLTATRVLTIAPNTVSRVMFIENATTGSQSITISQGSGANVTIATGKTAVVYLDGAGSGAAVVDAMALVDPGVTDTLAEVLTAGNATGGTDIAVGTGDDITFADSSKVIFGAGSDVSIYSDGTDGLITSTGHLTLDVTGIIKLDADNAGTVYFQDAGTIYGIVEKSSLDMVIRSGEQDGDIVFKGNDGGSGITALTLDMSDAGTAAFNSGATFGGNVGIGGSPAFSTLEVIGDKTESNNLQLTLKGSTNTNKQMIIGFDTTADTAHVTTQIAGSSPTPLIFKTGNVVFNENSADSDFRVESNGNTHMLFVDAGNDAVGIGNSNPGGYSGDGRDLVIGTTGGDNGLSIISGTSGTGNIYFGDTEETGTGSRRGQIVYDHSSDGLKLFTAAQEHMFIGSTGNVNFNNYQTGSGAGPLLNLHRDSSSPADNDYIGEIRFRGENDASEIVNYAGLASRIIDVTDGTEDGRFELYTSLNGAQISRVLSDASETVINQDSANLDFRVESDNKGSMFFIDASTDTAYFGAVDNRGFVNIEKDAPLASNGAFTSPHLALHSLNQPTDNDGFVGMSLATSDSDNYGFTIGAQRTTGGSGNLVFRNHFNSASGTVMMEIKGGSGVVFNDDSGDQDFRVESNGNTHMLFVDAGNDVVGIGTGSPSTTYTLDVAGPIRSSGNAPSLTLTETDASNQQWIVGSYAGTLALRDVTGGTYPLQITTSAPTNSILIQSGEVTVNDNSTDQDFRVESDGYSHMMFVDASLNYLGIAEATPAQTLDIGVGGLQIQGNIAAPASGTSAMQVDYFSGGARYWSRGADATTRGTHNFYVLENDGGNQLLSLQLDNTGGAIFNEQSADADFRVESNNRSSAFVVDASADAITTDAIFIADSDSGNQKFYITRSGATDQTGSMYTDDKTFVFDSVQDESTGDAGRFLFRSTNGAASDVGLLLLEQNEAVFNEDSNNIDFRVESDSNTHALFVDASTSAVMIGTSTAIASGVAPGVRYGPGHQAGTLSSVTTVASSTTTNVIDMADAMVSNSSGPGIYLVSIVREDNSFGTNFVGVFGANNASQCTLYGTIIANGITVSVSGSSIAMNTTTADDYHTNVIPLTIN